MILLPRPPESLAEQYSRAPYLNGGVVRSYYPPTVADMPPPDAISGWQQEEQYHAHSIDPTVVSRMSDIDLASYASGRARRFVGKVRDAFGDMGLLEVLDDDYRRYCGVDSSARIQLIDGFIRWGGFLSAPFNSGVHFDAVGVSRGHDPHIIYIGWLGSATSAYAALYSSFEAAREEHASRGILGRQMSGVSRMSNTVHHGAPQSIYPQQRLGFRLTLGTAHLTNRGR